MNIHEIIRQYRKSLLIFIVIIISLFALSAFYLYNKNPYGSGISIKSLLLLSKNQAPDRDTVFNVEHSLYETVQRNSLSAIGSYTVKDVMPRSDSFRQSYDKETKLHNVDVIVDIASISQSYHVQYQWANDKNTPTDQYGIMISCLPKDQLNLGDFPCSDLTSDMSGESDGYINLNWYSVKDDYGINIDSQVQPYEVVFIENQILGDFKSNNKLEKKDIAANIEEPVIRDISNGNNSLEFKIQVENKANYRVFINYNDGRYNSITNLDTGKIIERRTE